MVDRARVEVEFEASVRCRRRCERRGVDHLVRCSPCPRVLSRKFRLRGQPGVGLQRANGLYMLLPWRYVPADCMNLVMNAETSSSGGAQSKAPRSSSVQPSRDMFDV